MEDVALMVPKVVMEEVLKEGVEVVPKEKDEVEGIPEEVVGVLEGMVVWYVAKEVQEGDMAKNERTSDTMEDVAFVLEGTMEVKKGKNRAADVPKLVVNKKPKLLS